MAQGDNLTGIVKGKFQKLRALVNPQVARKAKFAEIYEGNKWGGRESVSGRGSDLDQTEVVRQELPHLLGELKVRTLLDVPCGDLHWMKEVALDLDQYIGGDIVPALIERNQDRYGSAMRRFVTLDITSDPLPAVDLIFSRDCLVHLPPNQVMDALKNFRKSGSRYLLTTTFPRATVQENMAIAQWRALNLQLAPFHLPKPIALINEQCPEVDPARDNTDKSLGLWRLEDVAL